VTGFQTCALPISPKPQNPLFALMNLMDMHRLLIYSN